MSLETLIVVAAYDDTFKENLKTLRGAPYVVKDTSEGGHPTGAFIRAYREHPAKSYLFIQDSMRSIVPDCTKDFKQHGASVVAWGVFPMCFDSEEQQNWVLRQYAPEVRPKWGIFGPVFYATREALEKAEPHFPEVPPNRMMAQGTERAWAFTFEAAGIPIGWLGLWDNHLMSEGPYPVFRKKFAARP